MTVKHRTPLTPTLDKLSVLTFSLAEQTFGLPITAVKQIIDMVAITRLSQTPPAIRGIINVRGQIALVLDLRLHYGLPFKPYQLHTPIILVNYKEYLLGIIVDTVETVIEIAQEESITSDNIIPEELSATGIPSSSITYFRGKSDDDHPLILILDLNTLLTQPEIGTWVQKTLSHKLKEMLV